MDKIIYFWELSLIKELGFEINFLDRNYLKTLVNNTIEINDKRFKIPKLYLDHNTEKISQIEIKEALAFNKSLIMKNFIEPNRIRLPLSRNILEKYYN